MTYDLASKHEEALKSRKFCSFVLDESHYLKNLAAKRTQSVHAIVGAAGSDAVLLLLSVRSFNDVVFVIADLV